MYNDNKQQQAVILKGIASQILSMNMPSIAEVNKLLSLFGLGKLEPYQFYIITNHDDPKINLGELFEETVIREIGTGIHLKVSKPMSENNAITICRNNLNAYANRVELPKDLHSKYADYYINKDKESIHLCYECNGRWWATVKMKLI